MVMTVDEFINLLLPLNPEAEIFFSSGDQPVKFLDVVDTDGEGTAFVLRVAKPPETFAEKKERLGARRQKEVKKGKSDSGHFDNIHRHNARAKEHGAEGTFTLEQFYRVCTEFGWQCVYCGKPLDKTTVQIDHVQPLQKGGRNDTTNIVPCCKSCNLSKGTKTIEEWKGVGR